MISETRSEITRYDFIPEMHDIMPGERNQPLLKSLFRHLTQPTATLGPRLPTPKASSAPHPARATVRGVHPLVGDV